MSFDLLAPHYRWMESVLAGDKLNRCRTAFLHRVCSANHILLPGEGPGRFLLECVRHCPDASITVLDSSPEMVRQAQRRLAKSSPACKPVTFECVDVLQWNPGRCLFDLLGINFFLDCFSAPEVPRVVDILAAASAPASAWLVSDFQLPASGLARWRAILIHRAMYAFFRPLTGITGRRVISPAERLRQHGFHCIAAREFEWGLLRSELWVRRPLS